MLKIISNNLFKGDKVVWMIYFFLCMISLVEIYSASSSLTYTHGNHFDPMIRQAGFLFVGLIIILIVHRIPCKYFKLFPIFLLPASILLLLYVLFFGGTINGGNRWIDLGFLSFQPSEVAKAALIMSLAAVLSKTQNEESVVTKHGRKTVVMATKGGYNKPFKICSMLVIVICGLIVSENFSTAAILFTVSIIMMYIGNIPRSLMLKGLICIGFVGALFVGTLLMIPDSFAKTVGGRVETWKHRIENKIGVSKKADLIDEKENDYDLAENWQVGNSNIAIANSNMIGLGPGNSVQRDFLSHAESDFIYSIIIEETGVAGAIFVIFLYFALLIRVNKIAKKCDKFFPAFLVTGFGLILVLQALINMGVAVGMLPVTGQPLPLISKGGTSIIITCFYFGVILSISRYAEKVSETATEPAEMSSVIETNEYFSGVGME
jgi:cell division protein FtsW